MFDISDVNAGGALNYQCSLKCSEYEITFMAVKKQTKNILKTISQQNCYSFFFIFKTDIDTNTQEIRKCEKARSGNTYSSY